METSKAIEILWAKGYRANASNIIRGYIVVLDPVHTYSGSGPAKIEYQQRVIHNSQVWNFINERE